MTTNAAIDRLIHHAVILELNTSSYRTEQAKKNGINTDCVQENDSDKSTRNMTKKRASKDKKKEDIMT